MPTTPSSFWSKELITGHSKIDSQHQTLFEALHRLRIAVETGASEEEVSRCLTFLKAYTRVHFETEEALYATQPELDVVDHIAAHQRILETAASLLQRHHRGEKTFPVRP